MKKVRIVAALLCASMGVAATASFAQPVPYPQHDDRGVYHDDHGHPAPPPPDAHRAPPPDAHRAPPPPPPRAEMQRREDWRKGQRIEAEYRDRQYVVDNWHDHGLRQPPRGYQWIEVGGDYLLIAAATGIIADMVLMR
jgi:Ni/Co efflux regulator RcnB